MSSIFGADTLREGASPRTSAVLLVGFPKALAHEIAIALAGRGWRSDITACAQDGLQRCAARQYSLILVDFQNVEPFAPDVVAAFRRAVHTHSQPQIVATGGPALAKVRDPLHEAGAQHVLAGRHNLIAQIKTLANTVLMQSF